MPTELSQEVRSFVASHLPSVDHLQVFMLLVQAPGHWWDGPAVARELGLDGQRAGRVLEALASRNLFDIRITGEVRYQFRPGTPALGDAALACAQAYRQQPLRVLRLVSGSAGSSVRDFADAFRIRRDDDR